MANGFVLKRSGLLTSQEYQAIMKSASRTLRLYEQEPPHRRMKRFGESVYIKEVGAVEAQTASRSYFDEIIIGWCNKPVRTADKEPS